jgi:hypothetical protein
MSEKTPLELAQALRQTAQWVRTAPPAERVKGLTHTRGDGPETLTARGATRFCAIGRLGYYLDPYQHAYTAIRMLGWDESANAQQIYEPFDAGMRQLEMGSPHLAQATFEVCARLLEAHAEAYEAQIEALTAPQPTSAQPVCV